MSHLTGEWELSPVAGPSGLNVSRRSYLTDSSLNDTTRTGYQEESSVDPTAADFYEIDAWEEEVEYCEEELPSTSAILDTGTTDGRTVQIAVRDFVSRLQDLLQQMDDRCSVLPISISPKLRDCVDNIRLRAHAFMRNFVPRILAIEISRAVHLINQSEDVWRIVDNFDAHQSRFYRFLYRRHTTAFLKIVKEFTDAVTDDYHEAVETWDSLPPDPSRPANFFDAVKLCAQSLKGDIDTLITESTPEEVDFERIWETVSRLHSAICEMSFKAKENWESRGDQYLGFQLNPELKPGWQDWSNVDRLINQYLKPDYGEPSEENMFLREFFKTDVEQPQTLKVFFETPLNPRARRAQPTYTGSPLRRGLSVVRELMENVPHDVRQERGLLEKTAPRQRPRVVLPLSEDVYMYDEGTDATVGPTTIGMLQYPTRDEVERLMMFYDALYGDLLLSKAVHKRSDILEVKKEYFGQLTEILAEAEDLYESSMAEFMQAIREGTAACIQELPRQKLLVLQIHKLIKKYLVNAHSRAKGTRLESLVNVELVPTAELVQDFIKEKRRPIPLDLSSDEEADSFEENKSLYMKELEYRQGHLDSLKNSILEMEAAVRQIFKRTPVLENLLQSWKTEALEYITKEKEGLLEEIRTHKDWRVFGPTIEPSTALLEQKQKIEDKLYYSLHLFLCTCVGKVTEQLSPAYAKKPEIKSPLVQLQNKLEACKNDPSEIRDTVAEIWDTLLSLHKRLKRILSPNASTRTNLEKYLGVTLVTPEDLRPVARRAVSSVSAPRAPRRTQVVRTPVHTASPAQVVAVPVQAASPMVSVEPVVYAPAAPGSPVTRARRSPMASAPVVSVDTVVHVPVPSPPRSPVGRARRTQMPPAPARRARVSRASTTPVPIEAQVEVLPVAPQRPQRRSGAAVLARIRAPPSAAAVGQSTTGASPAVVARENSQRLRSGSAARVAVTAAATRDARQRRLPTRR